MRELKHHIQNLSNYIDQQVSFEKSQYEKFNKHAKKYGQELLDSLETDYRNLMFENKKNESEFNMHKLIIESRGKELKNNIFKFYNYMRTIGIELEKPFADRK